MIGGVHGASSGSAGDCPASQALRPLIGGGEAARRLEALRRK